MTTALKPKTNWHLVIWPILALWLLAAIYVFRSEWRESAAVVLPIFMGVAAFIVCLLNAISGSIAQRRYELAALETATNRCGGCGRVDGPLHIIDYHWYLFLIAIVVQFGQRGKFCPVCARARVDEMFRRTFYGSLLCPPIILWAWINKQKILKSLIGPAPHA